MYIKVLMYALCSEWQQKNVPNGVKNVMLLDFRLPLEPQRLGLCRAKMMPPFTLKVVVMD